jgi:hypothetical protein
MGGLDRHWTASESGDYETEHDISRLGGARPMLRSIRVAQDSSSGLQGDTAAMVDKDELSLQACDGVKNGGKRHAGHVNAHASSTS